MADAGVQSFLDGRVVLHAGDCRDAIRELADASIDAAVMDPPYALVSIGKRFGKTGAAPAKQGTDGLYARASAGFMGQQWDTGETAFAVEFWAEVLRVLKPGGHLVAFSGTRTYHRMAVAIEDAGFEIRDQLGWAYGSGFPKSHDVAKGIDKRRDDRDANLVVTTAMADAADGAGVSRAAIDQHMGTSDMGGWWTSRIRHRCACPTWEQWIQLKAFLSMSDELDAEVWRLNGRKGAPGEAWQSASVVGHHEKNAHAAEWRSAYAGGSSESDRAIRSANSAAARHWEGWGTALKPAWEPIVLGRKQLAGTVAENVLEHGPGALNIDGCRIAFAQGGDEAESKAKNRHADFASGPRSNSVFGEDHRDRGAGGNYDPVGRWPANISHDGSDEVLSTFGEASRFFYSAKADADDRIGSKHPTVKPVDLMRWLCRLVTPPGGTVLDAFAGTGTTGEAAFREGFSAILIEREPQFQADIARRMELVLAGPMTRKTQSIKARGSALPAGGLFTELTEAVE
jgi:DNA modification methylase